MTTTAAQAAAAWWAEKLRGPVVHDNGGREPQSIFAGALMGAIADLDPTPLGGQYEAFEAALAAGIEQQLGDWTLSIGCDYGPDETLAVAATVAGIPLSRFPWKTNMWVTAEHVTVSAGYAAPAVLVWGAPDWDRPACGSQRGEESAAVGDWGWRHLPGKCGLPVYHDGDHGDWIASPLCDECGKPENWPDHQRTDYREPRHEFVATGASV